MKITEEKKDDIVICKVQGEVNLDTSPDLRKRFDSFISSNTKKIIINFSDVPYIDSSGLATLIELLQRLRKIDGKFRICNMSEKVRSIFEITKLCKLFEIFDTQSAALENF
ncbi:MAG: STAS domain-containing protein [Candidatus Omnitrophica bacterium]|nr:STAS domain-containing protein [Candidatus Omnitrophota bacterium]MBU1524641.1 STAS domain-containing protein [Candidatus Omnitrophota bacterium]